ncbi:SapB/AmfS family lanthipeptide [Streptomyces caatingaensis]|nr:SapB/AmfS family lanthipeptide [Streptomyces caatingaensis]
MSLLDLQLMEAEFGARDRETGKGAEAASVLDPMSDLSLLLCH